MISSFNRKKAIASLKFDYQGKTKESIQFCDFCGENKFTFISHKDRYGFPVRSALCDSCGLVFLSPRMSRKEYASFYERVYRPLVSAYYGRDINYITIQKEQLSYAEELSEFLADYVKKGGRLFDIGGSTGVIASHFKDRFDLRGMCLDPSPKELKEARAKGLDTVCSMIEDYEPTGEKFDIILMCQTIDHLLNVKSSLENVRRLIKDNGLFFVDIVDFKAVFLRNNSIEEAIKIDHPYYFTEETMREILETTGFNIIATNHASDNLHLGFACRPAKSKPRRVKIMQKIAKKLLDEIKDLRK